MLYRNNALHVIIINSKQRINLRDVLIIHFSRTHLHRNYCNFIFEGFDKG